MYIQKEMMTSRSLYLQLAKFLKSFLKRTKKMVENDCLSIVWLKETWKSKVYYISKYPARK